MCAKLKCCLNYEVDNYIEASRRLPSKEVVLQTQDSDYYLFKSDILAGMVSYSTDKKIPANLETITAKRALEVIDMNKRGEKPDRLDNGDGSGAPKKQERPVDLLENESLTRFDRNKKKKKQKSRAPKQGVKGRAPKQAKGAAANDNAGQPKGES